VIVVDVNVIAYLLIAGQKTGLAQQLFQQDSEWVMPALWQHEFLNVLVTFVRHGGGKITDAENLWRESISLFGSSEREVNWIEVLRLACQHDISAYDAQYIVLAQALGIPCITEDQRLCSKFPTTALPMQKFLVNN